MLFNAGWSLLSDAQQREAQAAGSMATLARAVLGAAADGRGDLTIAPNGEYAYLLKARSFHCCCCCCG